MKLVVGLGNPGKEYIDTRHNVGFIVLDNYVKEKKLGEYKSKFNGMYIKTKINSIDIIFLKPQSFINLSGQVIKKYLDFYKIEKEDLFVICDDLNLNTGIYKLKEKGSSGGHNGLKDIENNLNTNIYKRLKIGISNNKSIDTKDYVLGKFSISEKNQLNEVINKTINIIDDYFDISYDNLMNKYNCKNK